MNEIEKKAFQTICEAFANDYGYEHNYTYESFKIYGGYMKPTQSEFDAAYNAEVARLNSPVTAAKEELAQLDAVLPRYAEDLATAVNLTLYGAAAAARTRKVQLRQIIAAGE